MSTCGISDKINCCQYMINIYKLDFYMIDCRIFVEKIINNENIAKNILEIIDNFVNNNFKNLQSENYDVGLWINSNFLHNNLLQRAIGELDNDQLHFFNPILFSHSIMNSVTSLICKKYKIRGYSNSLINDFFYPILIDFKNSKENYALCINLLKNKKYYYQVLLLTKKNLFHMHHTVFNSYYLIKKDYQILKKLDLNMDFFYFIGNNQYCIRWLNDLDRKCNIVVNSSNSINYFDFCNAAVINEHKNYLEIFHLQRDINV